jgi:hypothetical protein
MGYTRWTAAFLTAVFAATPVMAAGRLEGSYLRDVTMEVKSPHLDWATPLDGGAIKATFITPRNLAAREVVEAAERMSIDFQAVVIFHAFALNKVSVYEAAVEGTSLQEKTAELIGKLKKPADVIVLGNVDFGILPAEAQFRIVEHVANGGGLVLTYSRPFPLKKLLAHPTKDAAAITAMVDFADLPPSLQKIAPDKLVQTYQFGKGRIAMLKYPGAPSDVGGGTSITMDEPYTTESPDHYENNMVLALRAIRWAAGRAAPVSLKAPPFADKSFAADGFTLQLAGENASQAKAKLRIRDRWNRVAWTHEQPASADGTLKVTPPHLAAGPYTLDFQILDAGGKVCDFGYDAFTVTSNLGDLNLSTSAASYEASAPIPVTVKIAHPSSAPLSVRLRLADHPYGRIWCEQTFVIPAGQTSATFTLKPPPIPALAGLLWCDLVQNNQVLATAQEPLFFPRHDIPNYPKIAWGSIPDSFSALYAEQVVDKAGWHAGLSHPDGGPNTRLAALFDQRFVPYMTRIGLGVDKAKPGWTYTTQFLGMDKKKIDKELGPDQSFYNPAVQAMWKKDIDLRIKNVPQYGPLVYSLGDENHFTYDAGYSPSDAKAFIAYARNRYGSIDKLNQQWGSHFTSFDQVKQPTPEELRKEKNYPAWYDHRRFMEKQYADTHTFLANYIKTIDPHALVGAEGSVPGDLELTLKGLDFWGPYSNPVMDALLRSIGGKRLRTLWWGGYTSGHGGRGGYPRLQWRGLLEGVVNGSAWYNAAMANDGFLAIDFRYADYYKQLLPWLNALERGQAQLLIDQPLKNDGLALLWSHGSYSASFMDDRFMNPTDGATAMLNLAHHRGLTLDLLTSSMVGQGDLKNCRVLIMPGVSSISDAERQQITQFVENGGVVIADINPGILNEYCKPLDHSALADLFGAKSLDGKPQLKMEAAAIDQTVNGHRFHFQAAKTWQSPEVKPFTWRKQGKGLAILLNMSLASAGDTASADTPLDQFLLDLLSLGDVKPAVQVDGVRRDKMLLSLRQKGDCTTIGMTLDDADVGKEATIKLPAAAYVYRVDGGPVGHTDSVNFKIDAPFQLFCTFAQEQHAPAVKLSASETNLGQAVQIDPASLSSDGLYRVELIAPDGQPLRRRLRVLDGQGTPEQRTIRLAYNDAPGQYAVKITDVRTGLSAQSSLQVK